MVTTEEEQTIDLEDLLTDINEDIEADIETEDEPGVDLFRDLIIDGSDNFDSFETYSYYKNAMIIEAKNEVVFKRHVRKWSLILLGVIAILMIVNVMVMIYGPNKLLFNRLRIPDFDIKLVLAMITATFVNLFAIITLVFKYVFSPTSELLNHTKEINGN